MAVEQHYWAFDLSDLLRRLESSPGGLTTEQAAARLHQYGRNELHEHTALSRLRVLWKQLSNPLLLLLVFAAILSALSGEWIDSVIVLTVVVATVVIGYAREYQAEKAVAALRARVRTQCTVLRNKSSQMVPIEEIVPGDVVLLSAGSLVPADSVLLEAADCFVSQAVLTGESYPTEKQPGQVATQTPLAKRSNCVYMGTSVRSGTGRCLVVCTGRLTEFGRIAGRLTLRPPETEFDRGIRRFGYFVTIAMLVMVLIVFAAHVLRGRPPIETMLFSVALAVGLSPELLPAILSVNLARGAQSMARRGVLVRRLNAIENIGSMDVLCTDKTGTLTEGVVSVEGAYDAAGAKSDEVLQLCAWNAALQTGLANPLDEAILRDHRPDLSHVEKLGEVPFDFVRKRLSVIVRRGEIVQIITKGAFGHVLEACTSISGGLPLDEAGRTELERRHVEWSSQGIRVVALAVKTVEQRESFGRDDEREMTFVGFLTFLDQPKEGVSEAIADLAKLGVSLKIITGDNRLVTEHIARLVGLSVEHVLTGQNLDEMRDEALWQAAENTQLFVEVDPNQKERIILSLKKMGHVVGFLGDGINDAPAMHAADTSLSVEKAADVAREAADFVLLERHLDVIRGAIEEGRKTFANTLKYVLITMSANLGNMISMAVASLFLPFLPLLAGQILLNNFLSDIPAIGLADDSVDPEMVASPERWSIRFIGRFMVEFGLVSSLFDFATFGVLLELFRAMPALFRTGWFVESLLTELVIALVVRTRRPFFRSRPGRILLQSTLALIALTLAIPYMPFARILEFVPLPITLLAAVCGITILYVAAVEMAKRWFFRRAVAS